MTKKSYWTVGPRIPRFDRLAKNLKADVVVIGAGITGVTAAYLLKKAGLSVILLERDRCGGVDTRHTSAHLTYATDLRLHQLVQRFVSDHAQAAWDAGRAAMNETIKNAQRPNRKMRASGFLRPM